jgi:trimethylamine--corrinoid protein Co-methyltransferase
MQRRAYDRWNKMLNEYEPPAIDPAIDEALLDFIARKKASMSDAGTNNRFPLYDPSSTR